MNEFKVGLLAIATIAAVVIMSLKITSNQSGFGQYVTYRTIVGDASGIFPKTPIKVAGITAGRIKSIELQGNTALITLEILRQIEVSKSSRLRIKSVGFLGDKYIEIYIGKSDELLSQNDLIQSEEAAGIENLVKDTADLLADVKVIVKSLKDSFAPEGETSPMKRILVDTADLIASMKDVTRTMGRMMGDNEAKISDMLSNLHEFSEELAYQADRGNKDGAMSDVKQIMANLNKLTTEMNSIVGDLKKGKGTIGKMLVEDDIADQVKQTLSSVQKIMGKAESLRTELSLFSGVNTLNGADTNLALRLHPAPDRFYELGLSNAEFGPEKEKITMTTTGATTVTESRKEKDKNTFRFNAQLGKRIQDISFRGGLIESSGGIGLDYHMPFIGAKLSVDAFDYKKDKGANIRFSTEAQFYSVLYGKASISNSFNSDRNATVSAGVRFNDEDLKGLLGFFF